jgi:hypothetical protein
MNFNMNETYEEDTQFKYRNLPLLRCLLALLHQPMPNHLKMEASVSYEAELEMPLRFYTLKKVD